MNGKPIVSLVTPINFLFLLVVRRRHRTPPCKGVHYYTLVTHASTSWIDIKLFSNVRSKFFGADNGFNESFEAVSLWNL